MKASRFLIAGVAAALLPLAGAVAQSPTPAQGEQPAQRGTTFEALDADSDGRISKTEAAVNQSVSERFSSYDQNGNGFIEKEEVTSPQGSQSENPAKP